MGKMEDSMGKVGPSLLFGIVANEKEAFGSPSTTVTNFTYFLHLKHL